MAIVCTSRPDFNTCCENAIAAGCTLNPENYQAATSVRCTPPGGSGLPSVTVELQRASG